MKSPKILLSFIIISFSLSTQAQTTTATPEQTATAIPEATVASTPPEQTPTTTPGQTVTAIPEATVASTPPEQTPTAPLQTVSANPDPTVAATPEATVPAATDQTITAAPPTETPTQTAPTSTDAPVVVSSEPTPATSSSKSKSQASLANAWKRANMYYSVQAYAEAIPYFERIRLSDSTNKMLLTKLGDCYRLTKNTDGQLLCYGGLIRSGGAEPIHELYYGQALLEKGETEQAKPYFEKYAADSRGQNLASAVSKIKSYSKNADAYAVIPVSFNSPQNDLCAVKFQEATVFSSTRPKSAWIAKNSGWTKESFMAIYATQKDPNGFDTPPVPFMGDLESKFNDGPIAFNKDFSMVYFTRNNSKKNEMAKDNTYKLKILEAELDENGFSMVNILPFNNNDFNFAHPSISADGWYLFFASDMEGGKGGMDIYYSKKDSSNIWGAPVNLGDKVNTAGNEVFPFIGANGVLYFSSNGLDGLGGLDIYETKLLANMPTKVYNMGEPVNSKNDDFGIYLVEDCKSGFITSNRKAGGLDDDIYALQILREIKRGKDVTIKVKDKTSGEFLANAKVVINGDTVRTNEKGEYATMAEEDMSYKIVALKDDYFKAEDSMSTKSSLDDAFTKELLLEKDPKLFLRALITDAKTNSLLEGVTLKLTDISTNTEFDTYTTTSEGDYFKFLFSNRIGDKLTYLIRIEKTGYLQRTVIFTHTIEKPGEINMNETLNLSLGKVEVGMDLAKMIDMKPIYFDLGKSTIRKDAALELDKIVQVMNEYPNMFIELGSHTDCRSNAKSNLKLSDARAKASAAYIVKKGIDKTRIVGKGYGESKLLNNCACEGKVESKCAEEEHTVNRRTEFLITKLK